MANADNIAVFPEDVFDPLGLNVVGNGDALQGAVQAAGLDANGAQGPQDETDTTHMGVTEKALLRVQNMDLGKS